MRRVAGDDRGCRRDFRSAAVALDSSASPGVPRAVHRPTGLEHRNPHAERGIGVAHGRSRRVVVHDRAGSYCQHVAGPARRHPRRRTGRHLRSTPAVDRWTVVDAGLCSGARGHVVRPRGHPDRSAGAHLRARHGLGPFVSCVSGHPARPGPSTRVPPGVRTELTDLQRGPRRRARHWRLRGRHRWSWLGVPDQCGVVPRHRRRTRVVAAAHDRDLSARRNAQRGDARRVALCRALARAARNPQSNGALLPARGRASGTAADHRSQPAAPEQRRLRRAARMLRNGGRVRRGDSAASRSPLRSRPTRVRVDAGPRRGDRRRRNQQDHLDHRARHAARRPGLGNGSDQHRRGLVLRPAGVGAGTRHGPVHARALRCCRARQRRLGRARQRQPHRCTSRRGRRTGADARVERGDGTSARSPGSTCGSCRPTIRPSR